MTRLDEEADRITIRAFEALVGRRFKATHVTIEREIDQPLALVIRWVHDMVMLKFRVEPKTLVIRFRLNDCRCSHSFDMHKSSYEGSCTATGCDCSGFMEAMDGPTG